MAFAHKVNRVTLQGQSFGGAEEWSTGFYVGAEDADVGLPTQAFADDVKTAWNTFFSAANTHISNYWNTTKVKVSNINTDGSTNLDATVFSDWATPIYGAQSGGSFPAQVALVATLRSSIARGLGAKGRMYLPGVYVTVGSNGQFGTTEALQIANTLKTFLTAVNTAAPAGCSVVLASKGHSVGGTGGLNAEVIGVRVGTVYDTQRRRRNQLTENYQAVTL